MLLNDQIARRLDEVADLLNEQGARNHLRHACYILWFQSDSPENMLDGTSTEYSRRPLKDPAHNGRRCAEVRCGPEDLLNLKRLASFSTINRAAGKEIIQRLLAPQ